MRLVLPIFWRLGMEGRENGEDVLRGRLAALPKKRRNVITMLSFFFYFPVVGCPIHLSLRHAHHSLDAAATHSLTHSLREEWGNPRIW